MSKPSWKISKRKTRDMIASPIAYKLKHVDEKYDKELFKDISTLKEILNSNKEFLRIIDTKSINISIGIRVIIQVMENYLSNAINKDNRHTFKNGVKTMNKNMIESSLRLLNMADKAEISQELTEVKNRIYKAAWRCNIQISEMYSEIKHEKAEEI